MLVFGKKDTYGTISIVKLEGCWFVRLDCGDLAASHVVPVVAL